MIFSNSTFRSAPKLMYCPACRIRTVHYETPTGEWTCWCDEAMQEEVITQIAQERRDAIMQALEEEQVQLTPRLTKELAELEAALGGVQ